MKEYLDNSLKFKKEFLLHMYFHLLVDEVSDLEAHMFRPERGKDSL
jgi:hypothetical protein